MEERKCKVYIIEQGDTIPLMFDIRQVSCGFSFYKLPMSDLEIIANYKNGLKSQVYFKAFTFLNNHKSITKMLHGRYSPSHAPMLMFITFFLLTMRIRWYDGDNRISSSILMHTTPLGGIRYFGDNVHLQQFTQDKNSNQDMGLSYDLAVFHVNTSKRL